MNVTHRQHPPNEHEGYPPLLLTTQQAAAVLGVGRTTIYALIKTGDLTPVHIGRCCRLSRAELERYVRRLDAPPAAVPHRLRASRRTSPNQDGLFEVGTEPVDADGCGCRRSARHPAGPDSAPADQRRRDEP